MNARYGYCLAGFVLCCSVVNGMEPQPTRTHPTESRPNIVLIMADDLGYECIEANGGESYKTPNLNKLAAEGVRFEHCYSQPICTPSRVKLMTGVSNARNYAQFGLLEKTQSTFANLLRDAGYATCITGKWQLGKDIKLPSHFGFDQHCLWHMLRRTSRYPNPGFEVNGERKDFKQGYGPDVTTEFACNFIERNKKRPFLLYYPMMLTHCPFEPTPDSSDWDADSPGSKTYKGEPKYFGDMVTYMDKVVGRIVKQLEDSGVRDNTLLVFTGDNGTDSPIVSKMNGQKVIGQKGKTTDGGTRVPLIVQWPGKHKIGSVRQDLVDFSDFLPTLCDAAGVQIPSDRRQDGRSFLPQVKGEAGNPREWIYIWYSRNGGRKGKEFTRNQRYKLYRTGEFFDISNDVMETSPLSELTKQQQSVRTKLKAGLDQFSNARPEKFAAWNENKAKQKKKNQKKTNPVKQPN